MRLLPIAFILGLSGNISALDLFDGQDSYNPVPEMRYLIDDSASLTASQAREKMTEAPTIGQDVANFGMTSKTYWFLFTLENISHKENQWYLGVNYPLLAHIRLYDIYGENEEVYELGSSLPFSRRFVKNTNHVFILNLTEKKSHQILMRIQTDGSLEVPVSIETPEHFHQQDHLKQTMWGLYSGSVFTMFAYYFFIGLGALSLEYLLMAYFFLSVLLFRLSLHGYLTEFLWPDWMVEFASQTVLFFTANLFFSGVVYSYKHLPTKNYRITRIPTQFCIALFGFFVAISMFVPYRTVKIITASSMLICLVMVFTGSYLHFKKRYKPAKYFLIGWSALLISGLLYALQKLGILPHSEIVSASVEVSTIILVMALSIGQMVKFNELNQQMQTTLEDLVKERTNELEEKSASIRGMLDNIDEAIFTIESGDGRVGKDKSKQCEHILGQDLGNVKEFIDRIEETDDQKAIITSSINACIGQHEFTFELNRVHLPARVHYRVADNQVKVLDCSYQAIVNGASETARLLIAIKDVSNRLKLEAEKSQHDTKMKMILEIIQARDANFGGNLLILKNLLKEALQQSKRATFSANEIFRSIHTVKGNSRVLGLSLVASECHNIEESLIDPHASPAKITELISNVDRMIDRYISILEDDLDFKQEERKVAFDPSWLKSHYDRLKRGEISSEFLSGINAAIHFNVEQLLKPLTKSLDKLAFDLKKLPPIVKFLGDLEFEIPKKHHATLINAVNHLLRNALDHGIEETPIRKKKGKNPAGEIVINLKRDKASYELWIYDDGQGFDLARIKALGKQFTDKNLDNMSAKDVLLNTVFLSRFTTRASVSEISGRGIGLDAVKEMIENANGEIILDCSRAEGSVIYLNIGLKMLV